MHVKNIGKLKAHNFKSDIVLLFMPFCQYVIKFSKFVSLFNQK